MVSLKRRKRFLLLKGVNKPLLQLLYNYCIKCPYIYVYSRVEWYWTFSKMGTRLPIRYIFIRPIQKNWGIWPRAQQSFHFKKIIGTLKMNTLFKICKYLPLHYFKDKFWIWALNLAKLGECPYFFFSKITPP